MREEPFAQVKSEIASGVATPSITSTLLEGDDVNEEDVMWVAAAMYSAGADTTSSSLITFMLIMTLHPEIQKKAQEEVDRAVGPNRLPTFEDRDNLPYLECIIKEVLRWYPVAPFGIPHRLMEDDCYEGHWIPADSTILPNLWAMSRDETMYKNPETFFPERFEGDAGKELLDPRSFIFGFGRRRCVGLHFADASLYIAFAYILATFNITKVRDENGREIEPDVKFNSGMLNHVDPWQCEIRPRSSRAIGLIRGGSEGASL